MNRKAFTPSNTQVTLAETGDQVIGGSGMYQLVFTGTEAVSLCCQYESSD